MSSRSPSGLSGRSPEGLSGLGLFPTRVVASGKLLWERRLRFVSVPRRALRDEDVGMALMLPEEDEENWAAPHVGACERAGALGWRGWRQRKRGWKSGAGRKSPLAARRDRGRHGSRPAGRICALPRRIREKRRAARNVRSLQAEGVR